MSTPPNCIKCGSEYVYEDGNMYTCPECFYEWSINSDPNINKRDESFIVKDAYGNTLEDGDSITIIKDIKVKGSSSPIKMGIKVNDIRLVTPVNGHNIECKIKGFGQILLKSELVKKSN